MKKIQLCLTALLLLLPLVSPAQSRGKVLPAADAALPSDTIDSTFVVPMPLRVADYKCLHRQAGRDSLQFPASHAAFDSLYSRLFTLLNQGEGRVNILHIGGSHVQAGYFSHRMRTDLLALQPHGAGGRGMLFPFKALRTNAPNSYSFTAQGNWQGVRCVGGDTGATLGLSGAQITTRDPQARLKLSLRSLQPWSVPQLRLLGTAEAKFVTPVILCGTDTLRVLPSDGQPGYLFTIPEGADTLSLAFLGTLQDSLGFTVRGLLPEGYTTGITYTASGINGAAVPSWLRCSAFQQELSLLPPDLVIFGIGINDANVPPQKFDPEQFKRDYRRLIQRIRKVNPACCFIFITNNDCWLNVKGYRRRINRNTPRVQQAMYQLAKETGGAVFDVFNLMGGLGSSSAWVREGLLRPDHIHFTVQGYELLGDLLYNALVNDYNQSHPAE